MTPTEDAHELTLAAEALDLADADVLTRVRDLYATVDPVPDGLVERIQFELTLDALHAEVAILTQLDLATSGVRNAATEAVRTVTFTSESITTMVTITPQPGGTVRVDGWAAPGAGVRVEVVLGELTEETTADEDGRFVFTQLPSGMAKFALHLSTDEGGTTVLSPTIEL